MAPSRSFVLATFLILIPSARAAELETGSETEPLEVHGFVSQGYMKTTESNYLTKSKDQGSFELTEIGLNFTKVLTERLRTGVQFRGGGFATEGRYNAKIDWFYLDYRWRDWFGLRAGRVKLPFGLYNEVNDVDAGRVPILLPQSVYPASSRNFLLAQTGGELYGYLRLGPVGALEYRLYGGTITIDVPPSSYVAPVAIQSLSAPYVVGARLMWETPLSGLRIGGSVQDLRLDADLRLPGNVAVQIKLPAILWISSLEYALDDFLFAAEYSRWHTELESSNPKAYPETKSTSERFYGLATYRALWWLQLGAYYSQLRPHISWGHAREDIQHDTAATLRFDIDTHWLLKIEGHWMNGTAGLTPALNGGMSTAALADDWFVFLAQTTVYF